MLECVQKHELLEKLLKLKFANYIIIYATLSLNTLITVSTLGYNARKKSNL